MKMKGFFHIHSDFSDGVSSLEEIKKEAQKLGASFVFLADHLSKIGSESKIEEFLAKCIQLSDNDFLMVPGVEIDCSDGYHFLLYNASSFISRFLGKVISSDKFIQMLPENNYLLVLAHASTYNKAPTERILNNLDGIEVWNAKYDSKYAPSLKSLRYLKKNKNLIAIAGLDAHSIFSLRKIRIELNSEKLQIGEILNLLKKNEFKANNGLFSLSLNRPFKPYQYLFFGSINYFYAPIRTLFVFLAKRGFNPPESFKKLFHKIY